MNSASKRRRLRCLSAPSRQRDFFRSVSSQTEPNRPLRNRQQQGVKNLPSPFEFLLGGGRTSRPVANDRVRGCPVESRGPARHDQAVEPVALNKRLDFLDLD